MPNINALDWITDCFDRLSASDREAQEELLMIVTSPISIQPMDEPIQRTNLIPAANRYANYVQSPAVPCAFVQRRRRSQSLNDSCFISAA